MISVVIPTKNDSEVFDTIGSVLNQEHESFEAVVVDGSDSEMAGELEEFCSGKADVKYFHESERSEPVDTLNAARNFGVEKAEGDKIALLDGDCKAEEDWLGELDKQFEAFDIVESHVYYVSEGRNCPMDRAVQNSGDEHRFLGAGLAFKKEVWREQNFREDLGFHGDTAFGFDAVENGYAYTSAEDARVDHHAGRFTSEEFVKERLRFEDTPKFFQQYSENERFEEEVERFSRVLFPKELGYLALLFFSILTPYNYILTLFLIGMGEAIYVNRESKKRDLEFCPLDVIRLIFLVPVALIAKRYAIWKGALKYNVLVV
ncbi:MAG: glycosyltransferase family 2 protein [Candidatus Nanohaloarchaea archaeon]